MSQNLELVYTSAVPAKAIEQVRKPLGYPEVLPRFVPASSASQAPNDWQRALLILRKNWRLPALFAVAVVLATTIATLLMKPVYEPEAKIEIDPPGREIFTLETGMDSSGDQEYLETQAQKLRSDQVALGVIRSLALTRNPEFSGRLAYKAQVPQTSNDAAQAAALTPAESKALESFHDKLGVRRDTSSRIVFVKFSSHDPVLAATIVNKVVDQYVQNNYETRHKAIAESTQWLSRELDDIRLKMEQSNEKLAHYQKANGIADVGENKSTLSEQMAELDRQLAHAQSDRIQAESYLRQVQSSGAEALPQVRNNPVIQDLIQKLADTKSEIAQSTVIYGTNHPNVRKLHNQESELEDQIETQRRAIINELRTNASAARSRENLLADDIQDATKELNKVAQYNSLKKEAQANADLYNGLFAKIKEAGISAASKSTNVRVVDPARVLDTPTRPKLLFNVCGSLLFGLLAGVFIAFGKERLETRIHTVADVRSVTGLSSVAMIPEFTGVSRSRNLLAGIRPQSLEAMRQPAEKFLLSRPNSPESEAVRALYTSIILGHPDNPPKAILIASPFQGEGKTTVAINLAIALAQRSRTVLVDGDLRRPGIASAFGLTDNKGLCDVLVGKGSLSEVLLQNSHLDNLFVVPAGSCSTPAAQLTCSVLMRGILDELREQFDHIVIDSPPILAFSDGRALSPLVDGVVLVGRSGSTTRQALNRSLELLSEVHSAPVLDVVLNAATVFNIADYTY